MFRPLLYCVLTLFFWSAVAHSQSSPYVGQELRDIKALAAQEISDYLSGKGMGLAKAAELNGYPGPAHVLDLATQLNLTTDQTIKTEALFKRMQARAIRSAGGAFVMTAKLWTHTERTSQAVTP